MKNCKPLNYLFVILLSLSVVTACKKDNNTTPTPTPTPTKVPVSMTVDVPSSLSSNGVTKSLKGNDIYQELRGFVWIGVNGAKIIDGLCALVQINDLTKVTTATFNGADGFSKTLTMSQKVPFNGTTWDWKMHVIDYDGSNALEFFWNVSPLKGMAIYQAYKCNHFDIFSSVHKKAIVQIEYSEAEANYSRQMIVSIDSLTMVQTNDPNNIKMFVGKRKADGLLDVFGNSNSPTAKIFDQNHTGGYQWAFVAHSDANLDVSIAKVGLPPCNYTKNDTSLFGQYSLYNVLHGELIALGADQTTITDYLQNANAPGYFIKGTGFYTCGIPPALTLPAGFTTTFCDLSLLSAYVPNDIKNLKLLFAKK